jgi:hypothetical protein
MSGWDLHVPACYTQKILERFKMHEANPAAMPYSRSSGGNEDSVGCHVPYREAAGCLMYLMTATCPHIAYKYVVSPAAQAMDQPTAADWIDVKRILSICGNEQLWFAVQGW